MPTYLCHGFRWQRRSIIVYVVVQNIDDAAPHWIIRRSSARNLVESFYTLFDFLPGCRLPPSTYSSRSVSLAFTDEDRFSYRSRSDSRSFQQQQRDPHHSTASAHQQQPRPSSNSSRKRSEVMSGAGSTFPPPSRGSIAFTPHHSLQSTSTDSIPGGPLSPSFSNLGGGGSGRDDLATDPVLALDWSPVKLLEEYDPANIEEVSRPHAYVADYAIRITDSCSIVEEIQRYESRVRHNPTPPVTGPSSDEMLCRPKRDTVKLGDAAGWLERLRDELQRSEEIRWYVVVCEDHERGWPADEAGSVFSGSRSSMGSVAAHQQYVRQQLIFEDQDRDGDGEAQREQLRSQYGFDLGGMGRLMDRRGDRNSRAFSDRHSTPRDLPRLSTDQSIVDQPVVARQVSHITKDTG